MEKREKASDIYNQSEPFLGKKVSFSEAYPTIKKILVKYTEDGDGMAFRKREETITEHSVSEYVDCSGALCRNGGFHLAGLIKTMVAKNETDRKFSENCQGQESSPKGRNVYGRCNHWFEGSISIEYNS